MLPNKKTAGCEDIRDLMFDYIDGALSETDAAAFEAHIAECASCARELKERREILTLVKSSSAAVPSALYGRVMDAVEKTPQDAKVLTPRLRIKPWMSSLAAVAAAVMILVVGRGFLSQGIGGGVLDSPSQDARIFDEAAVNADGADAIAPDKVQYANEDIYGSVADDHIIETTESYTGYAPAPADTAAAVGKNDNVSRGEGTNSDALDAIFAAYKADDVALLICDKSALDGIIPASECTKSQVDGIDCERYVINTDAIVKFTGYLEVLGHRGADYRAHVPMGAEFEMCEIILVTEKE